jgi:BetR domain.
MSNQTAVIDDQFVAYRVRVELDRQDRSTRDLARELDMTASSMQRRVSGEVPFSATQIAQVAQVLGVDVAVFFPPRSVAQADDDAHERSDQSENPHRRGKHARSVRRSRARRGPVSETGRGATS